MKKLLVLLTVLALGLDCARANVSGNVGVTLGVTSIKKSTKGYVTDDNSTGRFTTAKKSPFAYGLTGAVVYNMGEVFFGSDVAYKFLCKKTSISAPRFNVSVAKENVDIGDQEHEIGALAAYLNGGAAKLQYKGIFTWSAFVGYKLTKEFFVQAGLGWARLNTKFKKTSVAADDANDADEVKQVAAWNDASTSALGKFVCKNKKNGLAISLAGGFNVSSNIVTMANVSYITGFKAWEFAASCRFAF